MRCFDTKHKDIFSRRTANNVLNKMNVRKNPKDLVCTNLNAKWIMLDAIFSSNHNLKSKMFYSKTFSVELNHLKDWNATHQFFGSIPCTLLLNKTVGAQRFYNGGNRQTMGCTWGLSWRHGVQGGRRPPGPPPVFPYNGRPSHCLVVCLGFDIKQLSNGYYTSLVHHTALIIASVVWGGRCFSHRYCC